MRAAEGETGNVGLTNEGVRLVDVGARVSGMERKIGAGWMTTKVDSGCGEGIGMSDGERKVSSGRTGEELEVSKRGRKLLWSSSSSSLVALLFLLADCLAQPSSRLRFFRKTFPSFHFFSSVSSPSS